ncbi:toxin-antitoxin system, antitoxin component, ArsR family [Trichinella spiralis]|uniref:toxin-antitoxin system, antitoxin component, ArsR family n=1 Tax=Trichinella spiralis TaxID=6334 RepID=UPI0001EFED83|nr:toxin-antitoxin system, antitoxin component, ArsR family [Trichinella spiralis]
MQASQQFCAEIQKILRKPEPPLEKDIQVYRNSSTALTQPIAITKCIKFILTVTMKKTRKRNC